MGLDMYLYAERYVSGSGYSDPTDKETYNTLLLAVNGDKFATKDIPSATVRLKVGYWRKANAIHNWFVTNCQDGYDDCGEYYVSREQLIVLRETCKQVLEDNALANELLPPQEGFFFGNTEIDEYYLYSVQETYDRRSALLDKTDDDEYKDWSFEYHSSW